MKITLKAARVNRGLTQAQAAEKVGVSVTTMVNWENYKAMIPAVSLMELCDYYGVPMDEIFLPKKTN